LTVGSGITIHGLGAIQGQSWDNLVNQGTIEADDDPGYSYYNYGTGSLFPLPDRASLPISVPFTNDGTIGVFGSGVLGIGANLAPNQWIDGAAQGYLAPKSHSR